MKVLIALTILFIVACRHHHPEPVLNSLVNDTLLFNATSKVPPEQFECGTEAVLRSQAENTGCSYPGYFKEILFITTKKKFRSFLKLVKKDSITLSLNSKNLEEFYIPEKKDRFWHLFPFKEKSVIKKGVRDSAVIFITYQTDTEKRFRVSLATDSTFTNQLTNTIIDHQIGTLITAKQ